jgi:hypothetical protein
MSSKTKSEFEDDTQSHKHFKLNNDTDSKLETFLSWCKQIGIEIDYDKVSTLNWFSINLKLNL